MRYPGICLSALCVVLLLPVSWTVLAQPEDDELSWLTMTRAGGIHPNHDAVHALNGPPGQPAIVGTPRAGRGAHADASRLLITPTPTLTPTPRRGLDLQGHVRLNDAEGPGLADVRIYRSFAAYPGAWVATTDAEGY